MMLIALPPVSHVCVYSRNPTETGPGSAIRWIGYIPPRIPMKLECRSIRESIDGVASMTVRFARRVRRRLGLTQVKFARRIDVPHETIRNWEQGKRGPTGTARALLRILDKASETALMALDRGPWRTWVHRAVACDEAGAGPHVASPSLALLDHDSRELPTNFSLIAIARRATIIPADISRVPA